MTARDQMRQMLDQLMGTTRDGESDQPRVRFDSSRVCKSFLLSCCPHDILSGTRMDLGDCQKLHDHALRADFETASKDKDYFYDIDAYEHLEEFINDCDRRTEIAKKKLKETQDDLTEEATAKANVILQLGEEIGTKLAKAESLGAQGNIEESMKLMAEVEELNRAKAEAEEDFKNSMPASTYQQQKLRVCEVCGAYLGIHDNDRRLADHFGGKLHIGFIEIREKLEELRKTIVTRRAQKEAERALAIERRRNERDRSRSRGRRSRERDRHRRDSRERRRSRSKDRDNRRKRSRERERRRSRERRHSRSPSNRKTKSNRRSRSRDRRSRSRDRGSRDNKLGDSRRSRSRDRAENGNASEDERDRK